MKKGARFQPWMLFGGVFVVVVAALAFAYSGLMAVSASLGHWDLTAWYLHTVMRQSVKRRAPAIDAATLADPALVRLGAAHYEQGCAPCHGSPAVPRGAVVRHMTPQPPSLAEQVSAWDAGDLVWIVLHGVKFTGMPAWPARGREDEVRAVAAFLLELPGMDAQRYRALAFGAVAARASTTRELPPQRVPAIAEPLHDCARCHGFHGEADPDGAIPRLDIQPRAVLERALFAYAGSERPSGVMQVAVQHLDHDRLSALASYYAEAGVKMPLAQRRAHAASSPATADAELLAKGRHIAAQGIIARRIPACGGCHGPGAVAARTVEDPAHVTWPHVTPRDEIPRLAGQYARYLAAQLRLFVQGDARADAADVPSYANLMTPFAHRLQQDEIDAVSAWYASLPARPP